MKNNLPCRKSPCANCPFRKDVLEGWLGEHRAIEIAEADSFVCHKTAYGKRRDRLQCAGHMILRKDRNTFYALAKAFKIPTGITGDDLIFDNELDFIKHHT